MIGGSVITTCSKYLFMWYLYVEYLYNVRLFLAEKLSGI